MLHGKRQSRIQQETYPKGYSIYCDRGGQKRREVEMSRGPSRLFECASVRWLLLGARSKKAGATRCTRRRSSAVQDTVSVTWVEGGLGTATKMCGDMAVHVRVRARHGTARTRNSQQRCTLDRTTLVSPITAVAW